MRGPAEAGPVALIAECACPACYLPIYLPARVLEQILVSRLETVREAQDLKAVAIADGPELQLGFVAVPMALAIALAVDPARPTGNLLDGSIDARCPTA